VDPLDGPAGAVDLQQAGAHAGRDAGGEAIPAAELRCSTREDLVLHLGWLGDGMLAGRTS
jgi:hypothetical protein